jgi:chromate transporter
MLKLFWTFLKINMLTPSGPASVGLLHEEVVGKYITEQQFIQAVAWARVLPGSDALQMAVIVGYQFGGILGASIALLASILPAASLGFLVFIVLHYFGKSEWMSRFFEGVLPGLVAMIIFTAIEMSKTVPQSQIVYAVILGMLSFVALLCKVPAPIVLVGGGLLGLFLLN